MGEARKKVQEGLQKFSDQVDLLFVASDIYRASGEREQSLEFSCRMIVHHPENWQGYVHAARDFAALKRFREAKEKIEEGLHGFPAQPRLLKVASDVCRASGDRLKSLEYAELLMQHHAGDWNGYARAAQDLICLRRLEEAQSKIKIELEKIPGQVDLMVIEADLFSEIGNQSLSIKCAKNVSTEHPLKNEGCPYVMKRLIRNLRNRRGVAENWSLFLSFMDDAVLSDLSGFNLKWLKSICDTYVDHDRGSRGLIAMSITMFLNTLKVAETSRLMHASDPVSLKFVAPQEICDGYYSLGLEAQDACLAVARRMRWVMRADPLMAAIWKEVLSRVHSHSRVMKELSAASEFPERYFPFDTAGIEDCYGLTYEQLYSDAIEE